MSQNKSKKKISNSKTSKDKPVIASFFTGNSFFNNQNKVFIGLILLLAIVFGAVLLYQSYGNNSQEARVEFDPKQNLGELSDAELSALTGFSLDQIKELRRELADAHANLEKSNNEASDLANLKIENKKLLAELTAKDLKIESVTPPELDVKKIYGLYEAYGELVTLTYSYEVFVEVEPDNVLRKGVLYKIPGTLKLGVSFANIKERININDESKLISIRIPKAYIIANEPNIDSIKGYQTKENWYEIIKPDRTDTKFIAAEREAKAKAVEQVTKSGMLEYAQRLAGLEFINLLEPISSKSGYEIVVDYMK